MEKEKDALNNISNLINQLKKLNLSQIATDKESIITKKKELLLIIKQIVINFDELLCSNLRIDLTQKGIKKEDNHYWTYLSKYYEIPSVKFCSFTEQVKNNQGRGILWILISIAEKSFNESINEIYKQNFDKKFYDQTSPIVLKKKDILNLCENLHNTFIPDNIMGDINNEYLKYKHTLETLKENETEDNVDLDFLGANLNNNVQLTEGEQEINKENNIMGQINPIIPLNSNMKFMSNKEIQKTLDYLNSGRGNNSSSNNLSSFLLSNKSDSLFYDVNTEERASNDFGTFDGEGGYLENSFKKSLKKFNDNIYDNNSGEIIPDGGLHSTNVKNKAFVISRVNDFQNCYTEDFYTFRQPKKELIDNIETIESKNNLNLNPSKKIYYPLDKYFFIKLKADRNAFSQKDVVKFKNKEIIITNSILYYLNYFYHKQVYIKFNTRKTYLKPITIESQNYQCYLCKKKFHLLFGIPTEKIFWCSYYLKFICSNCIDCNYSIIPEFILKNWNFKKFSISKQAKALLEKWKDKPVIQIKPKDNIYKKYEKLREIIMYKRKIHKIFDLMKCENHFQIAKDILKDRIYLVLHENFFSLNDLIEIHENTFLSKLNDYYEKMKSHILIDCDTCHYTGGKCFLCNGEDTIYAFDIENVLFCHYCKKIYHRKCCTVHPCIINNNE